MTASAAERLGPKPVTAVRKASIESVRGGGLSPHGRGAGHVAQEGDLAE